VTLDAGAYATGKPLAELELEALGVEIRAVRRRGARANLSAAEAGPLQPGDVVVMLGDAERVAAAESRLLQG
jgi:CPA2 family monovalent cation:H+ antiporter-2